MIINKRILNQLIGSLLLTLLGVMVSPIPVLAWDSEPDANGKYDGDYDRPTYFPDWTQPSDWPNRMYYLCEVRLGKTDGPRLTNYEIAVYDQNNQLRHCSRSIVSQNGLCVLTIPGTEGDTFHFEIVYSDNFAHPYVMDVPNVTVPFNTNLSVGTPASPYLLVSAMMGDVNNSGAIDIGDAVCIVNNIVEKPNVVFMERRANLNRDDKVDIGDAVIIVNHLVGKTDINAAPPMASEAYRDPD